MSVEFNHARRQAISNPIVSFDEEADRLVGAGPYECTDERAAYRAGHYERGFTTTSDQVTLKMPKLKGMRFATAVIERYKRRETSVEEAIIEMYLAGVSTQRIEDVSEILWGAGVSAGTVSNLNDKAFKAVDEWRCRPLAREYPYVYVDGIYLKQSWGGSYENVAAMVAIGVNEDGHHEVVGYAEGFTEPAECHRDFLSWPKSRWLRGIRMLTGDKAYRKAEISRNTAYGHLAKNDPSRPGHPSVPLFALGASTRATRQSRCLRPAPTGPGHISRCATLNAREPHLQASGRFRRSNQPESPSSTNVSPGQRSRQRTTPVENRTEAKDPWRNRRPFPAKPPRTRGGGRPRAKPRQP